MKGPSSLPILVKQLKSKPTLHPPGHSPRLLSTAAPPSRPYRFHIGASWSGKPAEPRKVPIKTGPFPPNSPIGAWRDHVLSRPKAVPGTHIGEDFLYIQEMRGQSGVSLGVADGVGGWVDSGDDPSLFSQALMYHAHRYSKSSWAGEPEIDPTLDYEERESVEGWELRPEQCMDLAYQGVMRERGVTNGSSTACIVNLNTSSGALRAANLGDSGFCIIRSSSVIHEQKSQTHFFNCPRQLAKISNPRLRPTIHDTPQDADVFETKLRDGDIVILYTDGLSDNVFMSELTSICALVSRQFSDRSGPNAEDAQVQAMADRIVDYTTMVMHMKRRVSPFQLAASRENLFFLGGKVDDVTVIVALVRETA
ncbi:protein serine/threonine phosphatase 2C [Cristinia sonorae]|uniref:Protein phosphatase n=1 Tax=Cristinia sonorae TaxID=1940300 RepID=A0A8K0UX63_9AGAR|nr:protein serine/threonine phosphatase 2C [Cristinia sonorae]